MFTEVLLLFNQLCFPKSICVFLSTFSWSDYLDTSSLFSKVNFNCVKSLLYYQWKTKEYIPNSSFYFWLFAINSEAALWDSMKTKGAKRLHCRKKKSKSCQHVDKYRSYCQPMLIITPIVVTLYEVDHNCGSGTSFTRVAFI